MERTEVSFDIETLPQSIRQYVKGAKIFDSSSDNARTLFISGEQRAFLKISKRSTRDGGDAHRESRKIGERVWGISENAALPSNRGLSICQQNE